MRAREGDVKLGGGAGCYVWAFSKVKEHFIVVRLCRSMVCVCDGEEEGEEGQDLVYGR